MSKEIWNEPNNTNDSADCKYVGDYIYWKTNCRKQEKSVVKYQLLNCETCIVDKSDPVDHYSCSSLPVSK